jgi:intracellular sulfur oxidation DsrE/DsrF family protein
MARPFIRLAASVLAALCLVLRFSAVEAEEPKAAAPQGTSKVVFQVSDSDPAKWNLVLNNAANAQKDLGKSLVAEIVVFGPGIGMLESDSPVAKRVQAALSIGIKIVACENTMAALKLTRSQMLPDIGYVSAGVVELINRQSEGYAYIRP